MIPRDYITELVQRSDIVDVVQSYVQLRHRGRTHTGLCPVSYTHLRAHETRHDLVCRLLLEKKKLIHISEPTRLRRISYAVLCLKKKKRMRSVICKACNAQK